MTVQIEKGIPYKPGTYYKTRYPWHEMEVGDSIIIETTNAHSHARHASQRYAPKKFAASCIGTGQFRVWRIA